MLLDSKKPLNNIPGGRAAGRSPSEFDSTELRKGIKIEHEHTPSSAKAEEISMDHLTEDKNYYKKLIKMEKKGMLLEKLSGFTMPLSGKSYIGGAVKNITRGVKQVRGTAQGASGTPGQKAVFERWAPGAYDKKLEVAEGFARNSSGLSGRPQLATSGIVSQSHGSNAFGRTIENKMPGGWFAASAQKDRAAKLPILRERIKQNLMAAR